MRLGVDVARISVTALDILACGWLVGDGHVKQCLISILGHSGLRGHTHLLLGLFLLV